MPLRNPRSNRQHDERIQKLLKKVTLGPSTQTDDASDVPRASPPAPDSELPLSEKLWMSTEDIRQEVLKTNFITKISDGTLDPVKFGQYVVQDAVYCYHAKEALDVMTGRTRNENFVFFAEESASYRSYYEAMFKDWSIGEPDGIHLNSAAAEYVDRLRQVAKSDRMNPVYYFIASLPCLRLWPWIGGNIENGKNSGVYKTWVEENFTGDGFKEWEALVNESHANYAIAETIYRNSMTCEKNFFDSVDPRA